MHVRATCRGANAWLASSGGCHSSRPITSWGAARNRVVRLIPPQSSPVTKACRKKSFALSRIGFAPGRMRRCAPAPFPRETRGMFSGFGDPPTPRRPRPSPLPPQDRSEMQGNLKLFRTAWGCSLRFSAWWGGRRLLRTNRSFAFAGLHQSIKRIHLGRRLSFATRRREVID